MNNLLIDSVTGLKNQNALMMDLEKYEFHTLIVVDIDNFEDYEDVYGLSGVTHILKATANSLQQNLKNLSYDIYSFQSNQFILRGKQVFCLEEDFRKFLSIISPFEVYIKDFDETIEINFTIGLSFEKYFGIEKSLKALHYARKTKQSMCIYSNLINSSTQSKKLISIKQDIKNALKEDNIIPVFQPIVDENENIVKYEILMRMRQYEDNKEKLLAPYFFLETAIKTKQYNKLTNAIIDKSFQIISDTKLNFSLNLSFEDFINNETVKHLENSIAKYDIGEYLTFEILESENIQDYKIVKNFVNQFKKLGVKFAIDDFGSGYSNFQHLLEIEPDYIKIDGSIIKNIDKDIKSYYLVKSITLLAKSLHIKTIAEFVHSYEVFKTCKLLGVDNFQGFYFSPPKKFEEVKKPLLEVA